MSGVSSPTAAAQPAPAQPAPQPLSNMDKVKAGIRITRITTGVLVLTGITCLAYSIGALATAILTFPLALVPPIHGIVSMVGGLALAGTVGYIAHERFVKYFFNC